MASCTSTTYAGPSTSAGTLSATCIDNAGKTVSATSAPFAYDVTRAGADRRRHDRRP